MTNEARRIPGNPFRGLRTFEQSDSAEFFGRDRDATLVSGCVVAARVTVLFAGSGVGKSSFLQARLRPMLKGVYRVLIHSDWSGADPLAALRERIAPGSAPDADLAALLRPPSDKPTLLILDQFEELFQYHQGTQELQEFVYQLAGAVNAPDVNARLLLSMREEFLGELSIFDNLIPDLFGNYYRIKNPSRADALEIIASTAALAGVACHSAKLDVLLEDLQRIVIPARAGRKFILDQVAPPYLQIVCQRVWEETQPAEIGEKFLASYQEGEARRQLNEYCRERLNRLTPEQQELVGDALGFLITRGGAKKAHKVGTLADLIGLETPDQLTEALSLLAGDTRILRQFEDPDHEQWFELYHDMYAQFLSEWKTGVERARKERQLELEKRTRVYEDLERQARRRDRAFAWGAVAAACIVVITLAYRFVYPVPGRQLRDLGTPDNYQRLAAAYDSLRQNPFYASRAGRLYAEFWRRRSDAALIAGNTDEGFLYALRAAAADLTPHNYTTAKALAQRYEALAGTYTYSGEPALRAAMVTPDGSTLIAIPYEGPLIRWDLKTGDMILTPPLRVGRASQGGRDSRAPSTSRGGRDSGGPTKSEGSGSAAPNTYDRGRDPGAANTAEGGLDSGDPSTSIFGVDAAGSKVLALQWLPGRPANPDDVGVFDVPTGRKLFSTPSDEPIVAAAFSFSGNRLALGTDSGVRLFDVESGTQIARLPGRVAAVRDLAFSLHEEILAASAASGLHSWRIDGPRPVELRRVPNGTFFREASQPEAGFRRPGDPEWRGDSASVPPPRITGFVGDSYVLLQGETKSSGFRTIGWDPSTGLEVRDFGPAQTVLPSHDGQRVVTFDGAWVSVRSAQDGSVIAGPFPESPDARAPGAWTWSAWLPWSDGRRLVKWSRSGIRLWDLPQGLTDALPLPVEAFSPFELSPDGAHILAASATGAVVFSASSGKIETDLRGEAAPKREDWNLSAGRASYFPDGHAAMLLPHGNDMMWSAWLVPSGTPLSFPDEIRRLFGSTPLVSNSVLVFSGNGGCQIWSAGQNQPAIDFPNCRNSVVSPNGDAVVMVDASSFQIAAFRRSWTVIASGIFETDLPLPGRLLVSPDLRRLVMLGDRISAWALSEKSSAARTPSGEFTQEGIYGPGLDRLFTFTSGGPRELVSWQFESDGHPREMQRYRLTGSFLPGPDSDNVYISQGQFLYRFSVEGGSLEGGSLHLDTREGLWGLYGISKGGQVTALEFPRPDHFRTRVISFEDEPPPGTPEDYGALLTHWEQKLGLDFHIRDGVYGPKLVRPEAETASPQ